MNLGYELVSGGTENHLVLVNLKPKVGFCILVTVIGAYFLPFPINPHFIETLGF